MAKLSVSQIAKEWKVSRPTIQKRLKAGELSGEKDGNGAWQIDTAEVVRVFGEPKSVADKDTANNSAPVSNPLQDEMIALLKDQVSTLKDQLDVANDTNRDLLTQLANQQKLLEHHAEKQAPKKFLGIF